jgi:F-type H+-transporting ATPase subunit b
MLQLDLQQILSQALSFLVLLFLLRRFAWGPLLRVLDARRASIARDLEQAAQSRAETAQLQAQLSERLGAIDQEARTKIQQAILEGKRVAIEVQEEARAQARGILAKAKETVELELDKARVTLRDQIAALTLEAVERILQQKLDAKSDQRLVESVVDELERSAKG